VLNYAHEKNPPADSYPQAIYGLGFAEILGQQERRLDVAEGSALSADVLHLHDKRQAQFQRAASDVTEQVLDTTEADRAIERTKPDIERAKPAIERIRIFATL
jgi:hypothetical protein